MEGLLGSFYEEKTVVLVYMHNDVYDMILCIHIIFYILYYMRLHSTIYSYHMIILSLLFYTLCIIWQMNIHILLGFDPSPGLAMPYVAPGCDARLNPLWCGSRQVHEPDGVVWIW